MSWVVCLGLVAVAVWATLCAGQRRIDKIFADAERGPRLPHEDEEG